MLGLLWDQVPSDATKNFSRRLCRSGFYALFQIYGWVSPRPTLHTIRASVICLRNLQYACQAA